MKRTKWTSLMLCFAMMLALLPGMAIEASAAKVYYVGQTTTVNNIMGNCPNCRFDSCYSDSISFSDPGMVECADKPLDEVHLMDEITFVKPGTLTITNSRTGYYYNEVPANPRKHSVSATIEVVVPQVITENVRVSANGAFVGGGTFPEITAPSGADYTITKATIYREMVDYYPGDRLPMYSVGTELLLELTIEPKAGYYFWYNENSTGSSGKTNIKVTFNGETYEPYVTYKKAGQRLYVDIPVTLAGGATYAVTITNLDEPYHGSPLDYTATSNNNATVTSVRYMMFGKELSEVKLGDTVGIAVRVEAGPGDVFVPGGKAYWNGMYSEPSTAISDTEVEFVFIHTVKALDHQYTKQVDLFVDAPKFGAKPDTTANSMDPNVKPGTVVWSPNHTTFKKGNVYSVKIPIEAVNGNLFPSNASSISGYLNEAKATITKETIGAKGAVYYLTYTFPAVTADVANEPLKVTAVGEQDVVVKDSKTPVTLEVNVTGADDPDMVEYRWYLCDGTGAILQDNVLSYGAQLKLGTISEADTMIQTFYRCVASCGNETADMLFSVILAPDGAGGIGGEVDFEMEPVSLQNVVVYEADQSIRLEARVVGAPEDASVDFQWYRCDAEGNSIEEYPKSMVSYMTVSGIPQKELNVPRYYRCSVMVGNTYKELIFSCVLRSRVTEDVKPTLPAPTAFADVPENAWYYVSVKTAADMGLINGKNATTYAPNDMMTVAEAVKLAACMNIRYNGGDPATAIKNGTDVWFSTYMKYALDNGILDKDLTARANEKITRAEYVYIFSRSLPTEAFKAVNKIPSGSIPDVGNVNSAHKAAIYNFYKAGILNGTDAYGTFQPNSNIIRGEVAAILVRMMDNNSRVSAPAQLGSKP